MDGTTTMDHDEDEIRRQMTISSGLAHVEWNKHKFNLIDTPGEASFINDALGALAVVESALMVVNTVAKVEVQTERLWKVAAGMGVARMAVLNMMDRERAFFAEAVASLQDHFGLGAVPVAIPIGEEGGFKGVVDLLTMKAFLYPDGSGRGKEQEIPSDLVDAAQEAREKLIEATVEVDDALAEKYLDGQDLSVEEVSLALTKAVAEGVLCPIVPFSATKNIGTDVLLGFIEIALPSPAAHVRTVALADGSGEVEVTSDPSAPASLFIFKTISDQFSGRISLARVFSGHIATDTQLLNVRTGEKERTGNILNVHGKETRGTEEAGAGDIVALAKLKETATGDTLTDPSRQVRYAPHTFPQAAISFALTPKNKGDEEKVSNALKRLSEEDPAMQLRFESQTKEMIISGTSQVHVEVILDKMKRRYGVEVDLAPPQVPYRETIRKKASAQGRHKKQTGGRGQFGDCWIEVEPLARGEGYKFEDAIFGGSIPRNFIPAVEKGIVDAIGSRRRGRLPGGGRQGEALRRLLPRGGLLGAGVQARRRLGLAESHGRGGPRSAGAGHERGSDRTGGEHGRHHGRPLQPARPPAGH